MLASSRKLGISTMFFAAVLLLSLTFVSLPFCGQGNTALADPGPGWEDQSLGYFGTTKRGVSAVDANTAWAVGDGGTIIKTTDAGENWMAQHPGITSGLQDVSAVDANNAWAVGWSGTILHTGDGGETWVTQRTGTEPLQSVVAIDANTAWVAGMQIPTHMNRFILKTEDGGATWIRQGEGCGYGLNDISAVDSSVAWAVGANGTVSKTTDGGTNWVLLDARTDHGQCSIVAFDEMRAWVVGYNGTIKRTEDGGETWSNQASGTTAILESLSVVDADNAWAVGAGGVILKTTDGGYNWQPQGTASNNLYAVFAVDSFTAWTVGDSGTVLRTEDGGANWASQIGAASCTAANLESISAVDSYTAWATGDGVLLKTTDGGKTWISVYESDTMTITAVCATDANNVWTIGREGGSSGTSFIYKTEDSGSSWNLQYYLPGTTSLTGISAADAQTAWVVGSGGTILKTGDGGATWTAQSSGTTADFSSVCAVDEQTAWVSGWSKMFTPYWGYNAFYRYPPYLEAPSLPIIMKTSNGGASWGAKQIGSWSEGYHEISAADGISAVAVGQDILYSPVPGYDIQVAQMGYFYLISLGTNAVTYTHDRGATWSYTGTHISPSPPYEIYSVSMVDPAVMWICGSGGVISKSVDGGANWTTQTSGALQNLNSIDAIDPANAWAVGDYGTILKTSDGGDARPDIVSISPDSGDIGSSVTIAGCDFGATRDSSGVFFGAVQATEYVSWSDGEIAVKVPPGATGELKVKVITAAGDSNQVDFEGPYANPAPTVTSITPYTANQYTVSLQISDLAGTNFQPGAAVRLEKGAAVLHAYNVNVLSADQITCTIGFFGAEPGAYDVVVTNPDGQDGRLPGAFDVSSACGAGSSTALLMLGLTLGLLSLAGTANLRKRKRK